MTVNLDNFARVTLLRGTQSNEDLLEVYRQIAVTAGGHGKKWRRRDPNWHRYPGIEHELGLRDFRPYPLSGDEYGLCFTCGSDEYMPKVRQVITRAALGIFYRVRQWRADHGLRKFEVPCRVLRAGGWLHDRDPLRWLYLDRPSEKGVPIIRGMPMIEPVFNEIHPSARALHYFTLRPEPEGWSLAIAYGIPEEGRVSSVWRISAVEAGGRPLAEKITNNNSTEPTGFDDRWTHEAHLIIVTDNAGVEWQIVAASDGGFNIHVRDGSRVLASHWNPNTIEVRSGP